jgi:DNA-binding CsgD family transcriptional regulator
MHFWERNRTVILYAVSLAILFIIMRLVEYKLLIIDHSFEIYVGSIALFFLLLGIWISRKLFGPRKEISIVEKETIVEKEIFVTRPEIFVPDQKAIEEAEISSRELEVLELIAKGMSNQEIADNLFLSLSTIKTHVASIFFKLDVTRRTQAVEKAKNRNIIP